MASVLPREKKPSDEAAPVEELLTLIVNVPWVPPGLSDVSVRSD